MKRNLIIKIMDYDSNSNVSIKVDIISRDIVWLLSHDRVKEATSSVSGIEFLQSNR